MIVSSPELRIYLYITWSTLRYQDQIKADIRNLPNNKFIKLTENIDLTNVVQSWILLSGKLDVDNCIQKSTSFCPGGCIKFEECRSRKHLNLIAYCWNLGRACPDINTWFTDKLYLDESKAQSPAILIAGGLSKTTVEYFSPDNSLTGCSLPSLPGYRSQHSMNGFIVCGGGYSDNGDNCMTLGARGWNKTHKLSQRRFDHVSWRRDADILLMGGYSSGYDMTTEVAGSLAEGPFALKYKTQ